MGYRSIVFRYLFCIFIISVILGADSQVQAQVNSHYWSHQYGAKGLLLNGAVIGSVNDETAIFYNPGAMGLTEDFGLSLSLLTPTYSILKTTDFLGEGTSFSEQGLGLSPGLVAAMIRPFDSELVTIGLTTFKRFEAKANVEDRFVKDLRGRDQIFLGDLDFKRGLSETWAGLGVSLRLHERLGLGVSQFFTFRTERVSLRFKKEILDKQDVKKLVAGWRSDFEYGYRASGGMLTKIGLSWQPFSVKFGLTYTTHTYGVIDRGADYAFDDQKIYNSGEKIAKSNDRSVDLSDYKTPWSMGFGMEIPIGETKVSFSTEYFSGVTKYYLIDDIDDPLNGLGGVPELTEVKIAQANQPVLNIAIGLEREWSTKYTWFYGFRSDLSPRSLFELGEGVSFLASTPNVYHLSSGVAYSYRKSQFSVGLDYGFGFKTGGKQLTDFSNITLKNIFEFSGENSVNTAIHLFSLYITYDL